MRFTIKELDERCKSRPQGYREEILSYAVKKDNEIYELPDDAYKKIAQKYRLPGLLKIMENVIGAAAGAIINPGFRERKEIERIAGICALCPYMIEKTFQCGRCFCYLKAKILLKSESCPDKKW